MGFGVLGPLAVIAKGRDFAPTAPKVRQVLAFLLLRRNQVVKVSELVDELWSSHPPDSAMTTLQTYVYKLRKDVLDPSALARLHTKPCGYLLDVADENIDICGFERLSAQGRQALDGGDFLHAAEFLSEALKLWRGEALVGISAGEILSAYVARLEENRLRTLEMRIEADLRLGRHQELVSELKVLVFTHPLHEHFYADLMTALSRSGRRSEALEVYRRLRTVLIEELGIEPSAPLQSLHQLLLSADCSEQRDGTQIFLRGATDYPAAATVGAAGSLIVPAQLPPDIADFTGRAVALGRIRHKIALHPDGATTASTVSIYGTPGVGKTTLALHVAHIERARYPDGQLFADLHGASATPARPADILADFLRAVGVLEHEIPAMADERAKLFRTWCHDRRVLIVFDDVYSAAQVAPLLPATPECAVIITGRWRLHALPGAHAVELGVMDVAEGVKLLSRIIGGSKAAAAGEQIERIVDLCGCLPLALRSVGARLAAMPCWQPRKMVSLLESGTDCLDQLSFAELDVRAGYDSSYYRLDPRDRSAFRLLGLLPPRDFSVKTAADLLGGSADAVEAQLTRLVGCHLLEAQVGDDTEGTRYKFHKLLRLYARERLNREFIQPEAG